MRINKMCPNIFPIDFTENLYTALYSNQVEVLVHKHLVLFFQSALIVHPYAAIQKSLCNLYILWWEKLWDILKARSDEEVMI